MDKQIFKSLMLLTDVELSQVSRIALSEVNYWGQSDFETVMMIWSRAMKSMFKTKS
jgi:hypothetical protein